MTDKIPEKIKYECRMGIEYEEDVLEQHKSVAKCIACYNDGGGEATVERLHEPSVCVVCPAINALKKFKE